MPIVTIQAVMPNNSIAVSQMIREIKRRGAVALESSENNVWVIFQPISPEFQVRDEMHPPVVIIQANEGRSRSQKETFVTAIADAVAQGLSTSAKDIWIHFQEMRPEDIWFGGKWSRK